MVICLLRTSVNPSHRLPQKYKGMGAGGDDPDLPGHKGHYQVFPRSVCSSPVNIPKRYPGILKKNFSRSRLLNCSTDHNQYERAGGAFTKKGCDVTISSSSAVATPHIQADSMPAGGPQGFHTVQAFKPFILFSTRIHAA
jgi:hypothetical protein